MRQKCKAVNVPKHNLTKDNIRLVINLAPVNELINNIPSSMVTTNNLYIKLGGWKKIIVLDLKSALFHNHMHPDA